MSEIRKGVYIRKYKPVAKKINAVPATLPEEFRIIRHFPEDPLLSLPKVPIKAHPFEPGKRLTLERWEEIKKKLVEASFLWEEEIKLVGEILKNNELAMAWNDAEKGEFRADYFPQLKCRQWLTHHGLRKIYEFHLL